RIFKQWLGSINRRDQERFLKKVWLGAEKARKAYQAKPYPGRVTLFWSDESEEEALEDRVDLWQALVRGGVDLVRIPGSHKAILQEPHVRTLARKLNEALQEADQRSTANIQRSTFNR
ncbi:MAG: hypothetical protein JXB04_08940, partial [Kiritimatiellae bacterium]|nr:hypothetical protein [Kiritimatiellia bacterium]